MARLRLAAATTALWSCAGISRSGYAVGGMALPFISHSLCEYPHMGIAIVLIDLSILLTWATNLSSFNILVPMLMHAAFNTSSRLLAAMCAGVPTRARELIFYLCAASATTLIVVLVTRGQLGLPGKPGWEVRPRS